jgi:hypothetical protein
MAVIPLVIVSGPGPRFSPDSALEEAGFELSVPRKMGFVSRPAFVADWRAGRNAVYRLASLAVGSRLAVAVG